MRPGASVRSVGALAGERVTTQLRGRPRGRRLCGYPARCGGAWRFTRAGRSRLLRAEAPFGGRLGEDAEVAVGPPGSHRPRFAVGPATRRVFPSQPCPGDAQAVPQPLYNAAGGFYTHASSRPVARQ